MTLGNLGVIHLHRGEIDEALDYFGQSAGMFRELNEVVEAERVEGMAETVNESRDSIEAVRRELFGDAEIP